MKIDEYIEDLDLVEGQSTRGNCPVCHGHNTFTASFFRGNVLYNCYKNSCRVGGVAQRDMDAATIKVLLSNRGLQTPSESYSEQVLCKYSVPPYIVPYTEVKNPIDPTFLKRYGIDPEDVHYDIRQDRLVFLVMSEEEGGVGEVVDAVGRSMTGRQPKWLRYASSPVPYSWGWASHTVVIVEDAISAYVLGCEMRMNCTGLALLGTQLTDFHKWYIQNNWDNIIVALDPDARDKSIKIARELGGKALNIRDDLKYRHPEDLDNLAEMLYGYN